MTSRRIERQFNSLEKNAKKCITFSVPIEKEVTRIDKKRKEISKNISNRLVFTDSTRFMASSYQVMVIILLEKFMKLNDIRTKR